jgi:3-methyladenine DNA glycosylase AlkD
VTAERFAADVAELLDAAADEGTRDWWERYLTGTARFRGVKMADTRKIVRTCVERHRLDPSDTETLLDHAERLVAQPWSEDKLAAVLLLAEHALPGLSIDHLDRLAGPLAAGHLADWNSVDWYCVKVLGPFVVAGADTEVRCRAVAGWVHADGLWQRRAGSVAFTGHAATEPELFDGFTAMLLEVADVNTGDPTRWSQTSVGWLLRELARRRPDLVTEFLASHPELSTEARRNARKGVQTEAG